MLALKSLIIILLLAVLPVQAKDYGDFLVMDRDNLNFAELYLANHGHQVKAYEGVVLGELAARESGTGTAAVRGRDKNDCWIWWVWQTEKGNLLRLQVYPARPPQGFKGD